MVKELSSYFSNIYKDNRGVLTPYPAGDKDYDSLLDKLNSYSGTKLWVKINNSAELWTVPFISLLLADVSIFHGGDIDEIEGVEPRIQFYQKPSSRRPFIVLGDLVEKVRGKPTMGGFVFFPVRKYKRWLEDFKDIVNDGRGLYIPERIILWKEKKKQWKYDYVSQTQPGHILNYPCEDQKNICGVIDAPPEILARHLLEILPIDIPFIIGVPFNKFYKLLKSMDKEVLQFRSATKETISTIRQEIQSVDPEKAKQIASRIRNDIMRPKIANIEQCYQSILKSSFTSIAAAAIATVPLILSAFYQPSIPAYAAVLGTGGLLGMLKKYSEYQEKTDALKQNPYYILWKIKHINNPWRSH